MCHVPISMKEILKCYFTCTFVMSSRKLINPFFLSNISSEISRLRRRIEELKLLEKRERELEELVQQLHGNEYRFYLVTYMMCFKEKKTANVVCFFYISPLYYFEHYNIPM